jgi:hypothetical protein
MAPVRLARERVRKAAVEVLGCELGTAAAKAAAAAREEGCRRLAEAIIGAGGPMEAAKFVVEASPDAENLQPVGRLSGTRGGRSVARQATRETTLPAKPRAVLQIRNRKAQPFMQWARGPGGKPVLQCAVYLLDGSRLCPSLNTSDTEAEGPQRMRPLLWHAIEKGQLPGGVKHPAWGLYGGSIPQASKRLLSWLTALPWEEYELQRTAAAQRLGYHATTIDWLTKHDKARAETPAAVKSRRARLRKAGARFPKRDSWHFGPVGSMLAIHRDGPIYAQLTIAGSIFRWRLKARDRENGALIMKPVRSTRGEVRKASEEWGAYKLGTSASVAAAPQVVTACAKFAMALTTVGAPKECSRLALQPPPEVGSASLLPVAITRKPIKRVLEPQFRQWLKKEMEAHPKGRPHPRRWYEAKAKDEYGMSRKRFRPVWNELCNTVNPKFKQPGFLAD